MTSAKSVTRSAPSSVQATTIVSSLLTVQTSGRGFTDLTSEVAKFVAEAHARDGALTLFVRHTSASLTIQENADPSVLVDLTTALSRLAPENAGWSHETEGPDDMPAHVKTMLTQTSLHVSSRSAPGRRSIWPSTAAARTGARSCCNSSARRHKQNGRGNPRPFVSNGRSLAPTDPG